MENILEQDSPLQRLYVPCPFAIGLESGNMEGGVFVFSGDASKSFCRASATLIWVLTKV